MMQVRLFLSILCISFLMISPVNAKPFTEVIDSVIGSIGVIRVLKNTEIVDTTNETPLDKFLKNPETAPLPPNKKKLLPRGMGTGFVIRGPISHKKYILTNYHVIDDGDEIYVQFGNTIRFQVKVVMKSEEADVALLLPIKSDMLRQFKPIRFSTIQVKYGTEVFAIGHPLGLDYTVTKGIVSNPYRLSRFKLSIQTDASINKGNSGGPLFNMNGRLVGVNTAIFSGPNKGSIGLGFALESNYVKTIITHFEKYKKIEWAALGIQMNYKFTEGVVRVMGVIPNSGAEKAGFKVNQSLLKLDGKDIHHPLDVLKVMLYKQPNDVIQAVLKDPSGVLYITNVTLGKYVKATEIIPKTKN